MLNTFDLRPHMTLRTNGKPETVLNIRECASGSLNHLVIETDKRSIVAHRNDEWQLA